MSVYGRRYWSAGIAWYGNSEGQMSDAEARKSREAQTYPVKKRLPMLAPEKSKLDDGRRRLTISKATTLRIERMSSFFEVEMFVHSACSASTIWSHSCLAEVLSFWRR